MSDITLRVKADFEQAQKAFSDLANSSEDVKKKIEQFSDIFKTEQINKFIEKQKLLEISLQGTRGETVSMAVASNNYQREIERLIKSGLSPESDAIQRLTNEYEKLGKKIDVSIAQQKAQNDILKATGFCYEAIGAGVAALVLATEKTAEMGAMIEDTSKKIGMSAEKFQELDYAAKLTGVNNLDKHLEKLNKSMVDVGNDTGLLTKYLKDNDKQLLTQLQNVNSNEEAFMLLMGAINKTPDGLGKAELAMAAFGKAGQEMLLMAEGGTEEINKLGEEARKYGILSNEAVTQSGLFMDAQDRLKQSVQGVGIELSEKLMPGITDVITKVADFIANIDDWEGVLINTGIALGGITTALTTFIAVSKGHEIITAMGVAIKGFMAAVAGPAGGAALAIGALVTLLALLIKRQNDMATAGEREAAAMQKTADKAKLLLDNYKSVNGEKKIDKKTTEELIKLYPGLDSKLNVNTASYEDLTRAIKELNEEKALEAANEWITKWQKQKQAIEETETAYKNYNDTALKNIEIAERMGDASGAMNFKDAIEVYKENWDTAIKKADNSATQINAILGTIGKEFVDGAIVDIPVTVTPETTAEPEVTVSPTIDIDSSSINIEPIEKTLQERLNDIELNDNQIQREAINQLQSHLQQRAELETEASENRLAIQQNEINEKLNTENISFEDIKNLYKQRAELEQAAIDERITAIQNEAACILESETINGDEKIAAKIARDELLNELNIEAANKKIAIEKEVNDIVNESSEKSSELQQQQLEMKLNSMSGFLNGIGQLFDAFGEEHKAMAIAAKGIAFVEAGINSALAFTKVLAEEPGPAWAKVAAAASVLTAGLAQQIKIGQSMISAETGGRFIVPNSTGVDSQIMRVNPGEEINVTPRGMADGQGESFNFNFHFEGSQFASIINKLAKRGELYQLQLAGNL